MSNTDAFKNVTFKETWMNNKACITGWTMFLGYIALVLYITTWHLVSYKNYNNLLEGSSTVWGFLPEDVVLVSFLGFVIMLILTVIYALYEHEKISYTAYVQHHRNKWPINPFALIPWTLLILLHWLFVPALYAQAYMTTPVGVYRVYESGDVKTAQDGVLRFDPYNIDNVIIVPNDAFFFTGKATTSGADEQTSIYYKLEIFTSPSGSYRKLLSENSHLLAYRQSDDSRAKQQKSAYKIIGGLIPSLEKVTEQLVDEGLNEGTLKKRFSELARPLLEKALAPVGGRVGITHVEFTRTDSL